MTVAVLAVAGLFFLGHFLKWLFSKTKIPDLLLLVGLGVLLRVTGLISVADFGKVGTFLSTVALIVILYHGGLSLKASDLKGSSAPALGISLVGFSLVILIGMAIAMGLGFQDWQAGLLFGVSIGSTSSAIVIPMVRFLSVSDRMKTILSLESSFTDVLAIVIALVLIDGFVAGKINVREIFLGIGPGTLMAILLGILFGLAWAFLKKTFSFLKGLHFSGEAWAALTYAIITLIGYNGAMAVLALGFCLSNMDLLPDWLSSKLEKNAVTREELTLLGEIAFILKTFFFIYLGMMVEFTGWGLLGIALVTSVLIFISRYLFVRLLLRPSHYDRIDAMAAMAMGPRGLACAVLATIPLQRGLPYGAWMQDAVFTVIPVTVIFTSTLVFFVEKPKLRQKLEKFFKSYRDDSLPSVSSVVNTTPSV
ncbi:MAG: hypothetical protein COT74_01855 [Bdellovibrionales bacterium CG10_big_fil_rev_8_21_14_0_10_45_34]|nr:MAG: hypothetical protein COT74_01855 [Bdellovibrionales bacterium CG10_big_fil_rev_8_21_14_0_10_45_34]